MSSETLAAQLDLFHGEANVNRALVYARLCGQPSGQGLTLAGYVRGPHSLYSTTLPATIPLVDCGPGESLLARALIPDPCFWSPELPHLYDVHVEVRRGDEVLTAIDRQWGLRALVPRGRFFYDHGRRAVLRGMGWPLPNGMPGREIASPDLLAWHDLPAVLATFNPSDELCADASRVGVAIIACLTASDVDVLEQTRRLARHAAVTVLAIEQPEPISRELRQAASAIVARLVRSRQPIPDDERADAFLCQIDSSQEAPALASIARPVIVWRPLAAPMVDLAGARLAADELQADLAQLGDFAGYLV